MLNHQHKNFVFIKAGNRVLLAEASASSMTVIERSGSSADHTVYFLLNVNRWYTTSDIISRMIQVQKSMVRTLPERLTLTLKAMEGQLHHC